MTSAEHQLEAFLGDRSAAIWDKDVDRLLSLYAPDIVYFDLVPPLQYRGIDALRGRFLDWFSRFEGPIRQELAELDIWLNGNIAGASMLIHAGGTPTGGEEVDYWVRVTNCFRRSGERWEIVHEHVSLPVDLQSRTAAMDLAP